MQKLIKSFLQSINAFDVDGALALLEADAVIDDISVGEAFVGTDGVRAYLEQFFVGFHTASKLLSLAPQGELAAIARIEFTGDFGHEIGTLGITLGVNGRIARIDADLE